jgi:hopanoid-associated phosphorylase
VSGLIAEARIAERSARVRAVAGGGDAAQLETLVSQAVADGARGLISFGLAGGLDPKLDAGSVLLGRVIVHDGERFAADTAWCRYLEQRLPQAQGVTLAGVDRPIAAASEKAALFASTGAAAVDMESHHAARLAREHALPFAALRVVADPAGRTLPAAALAGMRTDGTTDVAAVLGALVENPWQLPELARIANDARRAFAELLRSLRLLGPGLGLFDLG